MFIFLLPGEFFLKFFERFFSSRFRVFIGIGPIRLYQSNTESVFRFEKKLAILSGLASNPINGLLSKTISQFNPHGFGLVNNWKISLPIIVVQRVHRCAAILTLFVFL